MAARLAEINKTRLMLLIEARDPQGRDIRLIVREAYLAGGSFESTVQYIADHYRESVTLSTLHGWFSDWGWSVRRVLDTPGLPVIKRAEDRTAVAA